MWGKGPSPVAVLLWMSFGRAAALSEPQVCYVLDGILFVYGIILTALYCRMKIMHSRKAKTSPAKTVAEEGVYTDLNTRVQDTYEVIGVRK